CPMEVLDIQKETNSMVGSEPGVSAESATPATNTSWVLLKRAAWFSIALAVVIAGLLAHMRIASVGPDFLGRLAILDRVFDVLLALLISGLAFCVGRSLCRKLSLLFVGRAEELAFSIMLGTGVIGLSVLGLGLVSLLGPIPVVVTLALYGLVSRKEVGSLYNNIESSLR